MNNEYPLISVLVYIDNDEDCLNKCLTSIQKQTYSNLEVFLLNNQCADQSEAICQQFTGEDARFHYANVNCPSENSCYSEALSETNGKYISFVSGRDWLSLDMYQYMVEKMRQYQKTMGVCCYYQVKPGKQTNAKCSGEDTIFNSEEAVVEMVRMEDTISMQFFNKLITKEALLSLENHDLESETNDMILIKLVNHCDGFALLGDPKYYRLINDNKDEKTVEEHLSKTVMLIDRFQKLIGDYPTIKTKMLRDIINDFKDFPSRVIIYTKEDCENNRDALEEIQNFILENKGKLKKALKDPAHEKYIKNTLNKVNEILEKDYSFDDEEEMKKRPTVISVKDIDINYKWINSFSVKKNFFSMKKAQSQSVHAVKGISFEVKEGSILGIVGKNGSGKSTLLKALAGIFSADNGTIDLHGRSISLLAIGVGFQNALSGRENIMLSGILLGFDEKTILSKMDEIIEFSELGEFIDMPVKTYSSGMYSKLAFSIGAILETDILLVDEVLSVGDQHFKKKSFAKMQSLISDKKRTVVIVSHNMDTLRSLCTSVMWMHEGKIVKIGRPNEILDEYEEFMTA